MNENNDNTNSDSYLQSHIVPRSIEEQFNFGLNLLANAFKDKVKNFEEEIAKLSTIVAEKDQKINELETKISIYLSERQEILHSNQKLVNENQYLLDVVDNLNRDLKKLEQIKHTILYSIGPEVNSNAVSNVYDSNKISLQTKLMNIANHNTENINNYLNLSKASENNEGKYYNPGIFNQNLNSLQNKSNKEKLQQALKKSFCDTLAKEAITESSENNIDKFITDENEYLPSKKEKNKIDTLIDKLNESINKRMNINNNINITNENIYIKHKSRNNNSTIKSGSVLSQKINELKRDRFNLSSGVL